MITKYRAGLDGDPSVRRVEVDGETETSVRIGSCQLPKDTRWVKWCDSRKDAINALRAEAELRRDSAQFEMDSAGEYSLMVNLIEIEQQEDLT